MERKKGYWNEHADSLVYIFCIVETGTLVCVAILLMFFAGTADYPFDEVLVWVSKIVVVAAAFCFFPVAFKIVALRLDARRSIPGGLQDNRT